jgi:hypothetical protein
MAERKCCERFVRIAPQMPLPQGQGDCVGINSANPSQKKGHQVHDGDFE